ncbi:MAG: DUF4388 domain-containing protein [Methyloprofundus sp.]|nr:DUF4388 domain-containing protein [Methyloprofundus sp.]
MDKILIVLNDAILLTTFKIRMHSHASNSQGVILAENSLEAIDILKENTVTLLVTDLSTSGGDSFKMLVYVAKQHHQMRIVVVSDLATSNLGPATTIHCVNKPKSQRDLGLLSEIGASGAQLKAAGKMLVRDFFQLIEVAEKTCLLEIGGDNIKGLIYFHQGVLFDSFCLQHRGEQTVLSMLDKRCTEITFRTLPDKAIPRKITTPLAKLLAKEADFNDENHVKNTGSEAKGESTAITTASPVDSKNHVEKAHTISLLKDKIKQMKVVDKDVKQGNEGSLDQTDISVANNAEEIEINKTQTIGKNDMSLFGFFKDKETSNADKSVKKTNNANAVKVNVSVAKNATERQNNKTQAIGTNIRAALEESLKSLQGVDGYLASVVFDMGGEVLAQHNNSKYDVSLIGANAVSMISAAVKALGGAGLGKCNFIQVNSEKGVFGAVWAVEDQSVAAVLLEANANIGMAKLKLAKVGETSGSHLA